MLKKDQEKIKSKEEKLQEQLEIYQKTLEEILGGSIQYENIDKKIEIFKNKMKETFDKEDLKNMNDNLKTLKIHICKPYLSKILQYFTKMKGYYLPEDNTIVLLEEGNVIYHESLHLSCNTGKSEKNIIGFDHYTNKDKKILFFGKGLNEIYTEILANRLFDKEIEITNKTVELVLQLEQLIDDLPSLYLNSDLYELVIKLSEYTDINEALDFVYNIDRLYEIETKKNVKNRIERYVSVYHKTLRFLVQCQSKKEKQEKKKKTIK